MKDLQELGGKGMIHALRRLTIAGPEIYRTRSEFSRKDEEKLDLGETHHEQYEFVQRSL